MPAAKLRQYLEERGIPFRCISHHVTYTAQETAASAHIRGRELAKTVMVLLDGRLAMAVLPAMRRLDLDRVGQFAGAKQVVVASERQFRDMFPDCEPGAMPPFGNLYGLPVFVDASLAEDDQIAFNAGTHDELIQLAYADFARLVQPQVAELAYQRPVPV